MDRRGITDPAAVRSCAGGWFIVRTGRLRGGSGEQLQREERGAGSLARSHGSHSACRFLHADTDRTIRMAGGRNRRASPKKARPAVQAGLCRCFAVCRAACQRCGRPAAAGKCAAALPPYRRRDKTGTGGNRAEHAAGPDSQSGQTISVLRNAAQPSGSET